MLNAAHASSSLVREVFQHCDDGGSSDDLPSYPTSTSTTGYVFLHLNSLPSPSSPPSSSNASPKEIGTPLRLIPIEDHRGEKSENHVAENENANNALNEKACETIYIHPLLLKVLVRSSSHLAKQQRGHKSSESSSTKETDANEPANESANQSAAQLAVSSSKQSKYPVMLSSYDGYSQHDTLGWLEEIKVHDDRKNNTTGNITNDDDDLCHTSKDTTIYLTYICSNTSRGRKYFSSRGTSHITTAGNTLSAHDDDDTRKQGMEFLHKILVGEVIAQNGILAINIGKSEDTTPYEMGYSHDDDDDDGTDEEQDVVFFMVNKILTTDGSGNETNAKFIHLSSHGSFELLLEDSPNTIESNNKRNIPRISRSTLQSKGENGDEFHHSCPGYESILEDLLTLTKLENTNMGAPTAVVLSGCSGVGKSRMASWFEQALSREFASSSQAITASTISAKDILLDEATSSFDQTKVLNKSKQATATDSSSPFNLLIIDDLDAIIANTDETTTEDSSSHLESEQLRALHSIVKLIDGAILNNNNVSSRYFILGITRASWSTLPMQLARVGRFEKVVIMPPPTLGQRRGIFEFWLSTLPLSNDNGSSSSSSNGRGGESTTSTARSWANLLAPRTAGCVAADIRRICADALTSAAARVPRTSSSSSTSSVMVYGGSMNGCVVKWEDVKEAARACIPSQLSSMDVIPAPMLGDDSISGGSSSEQQQRQPAVDTKREFELAWKDFGGFDTEKKRLYRTVVRPWKYHIMENNSATAVVSNRNHPQDDSPQASSSSVEATLEISKPSGVLFHGPPGVGKTFAAMCLASSLGIHCVKVRASEVFSQWLGGSEATLRSIFSRARAASPCILFFDELDSLATNREGGDSSDDATSGVQSRVLTTLLNEMDGITNAGGKQGVLVVAATNRLDAIDAALLRPGRLEEHVLLSYPKSSCIRDILKIQTAKMPLDDSVDLVKLSDMLELAKASCAEIEGICRDACLIAMRRCSEKKALRNLSVMGSDFEEGFRRIKKNAVHL